MKLYGQVEKLIGTLFRWPNRGENEGVGLAKTTQV